jgi:hypothetical protein
MSSASEQPLPHFGDGNHSTESQIPSAFTVIRQLHGHSSAPSTFWLFNYLPAELRHEILKKHMEIAPRFLDLRVQSEFAPFRLTQVSRELRLECIRLLECEEPQSTSHYTHQGLQSK